MEVITNTGTEVKISVTLECGGLTMDAMDFACDFFTSSSKVVHLDKSEMTREDEKTYVAVVDTAGMASGSIQMKVRAIIPDSDCPDGKRTEIATVDTEIEIRNK